MPLGVAGRNLDPICVVLGLLAGVDTVNLVLVSGLLVLAVAVLAELYLPLGQGTAFAILDSLTKTQQI